MINLKEMPNTTVHCKDESEYDQLMQIYHDAGWRWCNDEPAKGGDWEEVYRLTGQPRTYISIGDGFFFRSTKEEWDLEWTSEISFADFLREQGIDDTDFKIGDFVEGEFCGRAIITGFKDNGWVLLDGEPTGWNPKFLRHASDELKAGDWVEVAQEFDHPSGTTMNVGRRFKVVRWDASKILVDPGAAYHYRITYHAHSFRKCDPPHPHALTKCDNPKKTEFSLGCQVAITRNLPKTISHPALVAGTVGTIIRKESVGDKEGWHIEYTIQPRQMVDDRISFVIRTDLAPDCLELYENPYLPFGTLTVAKDKAGLDHPKAEKVNCPTMMIEIYPSASQARVYEELARMKDPVWKCTRFRNVEYPPSSPASADVTPFISPSPKPMAEFKRGDKVTPKETVSDRFGHTIYPGECYIVSHTSFALVKPSDFKADKPDYYAEEKLWAFNGGYEKIPFFIPYTSPSFMSNVISFLKDKARSLEDRTLIRANFTDDCSNLTCEGKEALWSLLFAEFKPQLVALAKEMVAEREKEAKKCCK